MERWQMHVECGNTYRAMGNRIKELREARGWSQDDLAQRVGTTQQQIGRLESEKRRLTKDWLKAIAAALEVRPADLLEPTDVITPAKSDVSGAEDSTVATISAALASRGLSIYRVDEDAVVDSGISAGALITVDETPEGINRADTGDIVLVEAGLREKRLLLRVFIRPSLVVTNRPGANSLFRLDNPAMSARIVGVVLRNDGGSSRNSGKKSNLHPGEPIRLHVLHDPSK